MQDVLLSGRRVWLVATIQQSHHVVSLLPYLTDSTEYLSA